MPSTEAQAAWRRLAEQAEQIVEAARHDPYEPRLIEDAKALVAELAALDDRETAAQRALQADGALQRAVAHAAAGEAWFALGDCRQALARFDAALERLPDDGPPSPGFGALGAQARCGRGRCLVDLQRTAEAIPLLGSVIDWYTAHGDAADETQQAMLSQALHTLGMAHADIGDHKLALQATERAVALRRRLAERDADRYRLALSRSLRNLGNWLNALGRRDDALQSRREMLELRRAQWRSRQTVAVANALAQAADIMAREELDRQVAIDEVTSLVEEAATRYLELSKVHHDRFAATFAGGVGLIAELVSHLSNKSTHRRAVRAGANAVQLCRDYYADNHLASILADVQERLSKIDAKLGELDYCVDQVQGARRACHVLREAAPGALTTAVGRCVESIETELSSSWMLLQVANSWYRKGIEHSRRSEMRQAIVEAQRALGAFRRLAEKNCEGFEPSVAACLGNIASMLTQLGRDDLAIRAGAESVALFRKLVADCPVAFLPDGFSLELAGALHNFAGAALNLGETASAIEALDEASRLFRRHGAAGDLQLFGTLRNLAFALSASGQHDEAILAGQEAVAGFRHATARGDVAATAALAGSLTNLGSFLDQYWSR